MREFLRVQNKFEESPKVYTFFLYKDCMRLLWYTVQTEEGPNVPPKEQTQDKY